MLEASAWLRILVFWQPAKKTKSESSVYIGSKIFRAIIFSFFFFSTFPSIPYLVLSFEYYSHFFCILYCTNIIIIIIIIIIIQATKYALHVSLFS